MKISINGHTITVISKSNKVMHDYVCLHFLVPNNQMPKHLRGKIPQYEIWMREDIYNDKIKCNLTLMHETAELKRMIHGMKYKTRKCKLDSAHEWGEMADGFW
jgi:hypothetical protein